MADTNNSFDKSNITQNYNQASVGLNMDNSINQIKKGSLSYGLNAVVENFDNNGISYQNEPSNEFCVSFPEGFVLIKEHFINEKNKHIFFLVNSDLNQSEIGYMVNNDCKYIKLVNDNCLNFNINYPIHKVVHKITNCTEEIYWADGLNSRRFLDLLNVPFKLLLGTILCDPVYSDKLDCNKLRVQPDISIPKIDIIDVTSGGSIKSGVVQFGVQYADALGNPFTSYYAVTNPTPIADPNLATVQFNYVVGKSVVMEISNLDVTGQFQYINVAVIRTENNISSPELIGTFFINSDSKKITYSGQKVDNIRLSMQDIFEKFPYYDIAEDVTTVQDILIWKGLSSAERINYQQIASKITLNWESFRIPSNENYANELNATNHKSYLRDEIYPFEIVFLLDKGKETDGFHIPGRIMNTQEMMAPAITSLSLDFIGQTNAAEPYWKTYNTASVLGVSPFFTNDVNYKGPYQYGEFAFWESELEYPCNQELWGDLSGQKIRHHKFPDDLISPIQETSEFTGENNLKMGNKAIFPIGVRISTAQIQSLINSSTLTISQKEEIVGYKIIRGDRSTNKSIVAKGILRNVGEYNKDNQNYLYPNYPYNDLNEDPFLNSNNNAFKELCKSYKIQINTLSENDPTKPKSVKLTIVDCNTNKQEILEFTSVGTYYQCSILRPVFFSPQLDNFVEDLDYDEYVVGSVDGSLTFCKGYEVQWEDYIKNTQKAKIYGYGSSKPRSKTLRCKVGTKPICVSNCDACGIRLEISFKQVRNASSCDNPIPLNPWNKESNRNRQIFNSPETSFGQPFLGDVLKLEHVMFGKGVGHFAEVKDNAKYRLLTEEAQRDALENARIIAKVTDPFSATAMFSAYQAYLTILINGIYRKNFAYSFNSIADYNYTKSIANNLGIKQRKIDLKKYLIPGFQSVGDDLNVNNYNRETSVFLRTQKNKNGFVFPHLTPSMNSGSTVGFNEKSRFTISEKGNCSTPTRDENITTVAYYASLKNTFPGQWGQIHSYDTVDTGFQRSFKETSIDKIIFGGDTFISRFSFKIKLPFFTDNRVKAPDDSDIFYDEIGNIAYPRYWHSSRSETKNYTLDTIGTLTSLISYKAHNFDCPNKQGKGISSVPSVINQTDQNRNFYDGFFYLFAYGIPNFYCETSYNLDLRQAFNNKEGDFWPHVNSAVPDEWLQESFVSILNDNTYNYNVSFSKQNKENNFTNLPADWDGKACSNSFAYRAIYSDPQINESDLKYNNWLTYRGVSYFDFPQTFGKLISLDGIQNRAILARFENKTLMYDNLLTLDTSNPQAAWVGNNQLFKKAPPIDFAETDLGYIGCQNKMLLKIPEGQLTIDAKRGQIFLIQGTRAESLSQPGSGLNRFFTDHLAFEILRHFPEVNTDNHFNGVGIHGVYDSKFNRLLITKLDYIPIVTGIKFDSDTQTYFIEKIINEITFRTEISLLDKNYFCNKSWTLSYNLSTRSWISFHTYLPNFYIAENNFFYSGINGCCEEFDFIAGVIVENEITTTTTTSTSSTSTTTTKPLDCNFVPSVRLTNCVLTGTGVITLLPLPEPCTRPYNLNSYDLVSGYITDQQITISSFPTKELACEGQFVSDENFLELIIVEVEAESLITGNKIYLNNNSKDCTTIPNGWYFSSNIDGTVIQILEGTIQSIFNCFPVTTITTTSNNSTIT
jgi:hypothetical protein